MPGFFSRLVHGSKPPAPAPPPPRAQAPAQTAASLDAQIDTLNKRLAVTDRDTAACLEKARGCVARGDKRGAELALRQKKMKEQQATQLTAMLTNLEQMKATLDGAEQTKEVMDLYQTTTAQIKKQGLTADKVDKVMDDMQEAQDDMREVTDALSRPVGGVGIDVDDELKELMAQTADEQALGVRVPQGTIAQPARVPQQAVRPAPAPAAAARAPNVDDELAALERELAPA